MRPFICYLHFDEHLRFSEDNACIAPFTENGKPIAAGSDVRDYFPELFGYEDRLRNMREKEETHAFTIEEIGRNDLFLSIDILWDVHRFLLIVRDETTQVRLRQELLQSRNENALLVEKLQTLNDELQARVDAAVRKERQNDMLMIEQSRFAMMGEMIANIAHQWRQPLNALALLHYSVVDAWEFDELDEAFMESFREKSEKLVQGMSQTIDDFRHFFQPKAERMPFDVIEAIRAAVDLISDLWEKSGISVEITAQAGCTVDGYRNQFMQVIMNLLGNAKDVLQERKIADARVRIGVECGSDRVRIRVEDNGGGIDDDVIGRIFEPYFSTKGERGTGLGLYMSRVILQRNFSGRITVENTQEGACFALEIPHKMEE